jgi:hypothetical protein
MGRRGRKKRDGKERDGKLEGEHSGARRTRKQKRRELEHKIERGE